MKQTYHPHTTAVHGNIPHPPHSNHALTTPIIQTSTYVFEDTADLCAYKEAQAAGANLPGRHQYGRYGNPTVRAVEERLATLDQGEDALLFPSGMAAITSTLLSLLSSGDHLIFTDDSYNKTRDFCVDFLPRFGVETTSVPMGDYEAMETAVKPNTRLILSESPTNPYIRVLDMERVVDIAKRNGLLTMIDSTFATPINQRPLNFGIDLVIHSATKYLGGHNDIMAGVVVGSAELLEPIKQHRGLLGSITDPQTAYLLERGLKTLGLRVQQQNKSAETIARYLEGHPRVERVWYPALTSHPDYTIAHAQMDGFGGVVSFEVKVEPVETNSSTSSESVSTSDSRSTAVSAASSVMDKFTIAQNCPSLGGVETLLMQPALAAYYALTAAERADLGIKDNLIRYAVGVEDVNDLLADLEQALKK